MFWTSRVAWLPSTPSSFGPASACSRALRTSLTACPVRLPPMPRNSTSSSSDRCRRPVRPPRRLVILPRPRAPFRPGVTSGDGPRAYAARHDPRRRRGARRHASGPRRARAPRCSTTAAAAPARWPRSSRPLGGSRPTAPRAGCGGRPRRRPLPSWMPGCRSRGPGTSPRPTGSSTAGGARPPASAGRRHTASRSRTCPLPRPVTCSSSRRTPRPPRPTRSSTPPGTCAATTRSGCATPTTWRPGRGRRSRPRTSSTTRPRRPRCGWSARCSRSRPPPCCASSCGATGCRSTGPRTEQLLADAVGPAADDRCRGGGLAPGARRRSCCATCPAAESTDLRNPAQVLEMLHAVGVDVPNTRKWVLEPYRTVHPRGRRPARLAPRRADRHDLRLPAGSTRTSAPTTGCAGGGRRATARPAG